MSKLFALFCFALLSVFACRSFCARTPEFNKSHGESRDQVVKKCGDWALSESPEGKPHNIEEAFKNAKDLKTRFDNCTQKNLKGKGAEVRVSPKSS